MPDREFSVGEVIENTSDLLLLPSGTEIRNVESLEEEVWTRTVNGLICTKGHGDVDAGHFVANSEVSAYFTPGWNVIDRLPEPKEPDSVDPYKPQVIRVSAEEFAQIQNASVIKTTTCDCGNCDCKSDGLAEGVLAEPSMRDAFEPKFPNPEDSEELVTPRADVLREAEELITGDRNKTYGPPTENFRHIAELLNTRFAHKLNQRLTGADVADLMILVKVARNIADTKRDNWVDIAGYAACGYECTLDEN